MEALSNDRNSHVFGGGCFWCVQTDFEKGPGAVKLVSGYTGGSEDNPTWVNADLLEFLKAQVFKRVDVIGLCTLAATTTPV